MTHYDKLIDTIKDHLYAYYICGQHNDGWDEADAQQLILDERASVDFEIYPTGTGSGETFFSGGGIVTSRSISGAFDGMVEASFTIQCSGAVTEAQV